MNCPGCWNPQSWDPTGGTEWEPDALAEHIVQNAAPGTEGITLSGGEIAQQLLSAYSLICSAHARRPDWDIGVFTGYDKSELVYGNYNLREKLPLDTPGIRAMLWTDQVQPHLGWVVYGRYDRTKPPSEGRADRQDLGFVSSHNQWLEIFWRSKHKYADFSQMVEYSIADSGLTQVTGFPV